MSVVAQVFDPQADAAAARLAIGGVETFSSVDWPGRLVATAFLQGCPWRCGYCHNPDLQDPRAATDVTWDAVLSLLMARRGMLDGVVFSGGEPTRQAALEPAMRQARELGYGIGLHTAGAYPTRLRAVLGLVDWVGLDIKATESQYAAITRRGLSGARAWESLRVVQESGVDHEVRITVDPTVHTRSDILALVDELAEHGEHRPVLQQARATGTDAAYAAALADRTLYDVIRLDDLPELAVR